MTGNLFVFEGQDGVGKTTIINQVHTVLKERGIDDLYVDREPTRKTEASNQIFNILNNREKYDLNSNDVKKELCKLYHEDRKYHIDYFLKHSLAAEETILLDRYWHSTAVYQSCREWSMNKIITYNREELGAPEPTMTFILKVPPEQLTERLLNRNPMKNNGFDDSTRFEELNRSYELLIATDRIGRYCVLYNFSQLLTIRTIVDVIETILTFAWCCD